MNHLLDNPVWNALNTGNKNLSGGDGDVRIFPTEIAPFVGMKKINPVNFDLLYEMIPAKRSAVIVTPTDIDIPDPWKLARKMLGWQMVCFPGPELTGSLSSYELIPLTECDVPAMLELTGLTKPGPFLPRTIEFGGYHGIFEGGKLISMAGFRLGIGPYREISAVCTHPDYLGRGYAAALIRHLIVLIVAKSWIPFLHVLKENTDAIKLYEKLGFRVRSEMQFNVIEKR